MSRRSLAALLVVLTILAGAGALTLVVFRTWGAFAVVIVWICIGVLLCGTLAALARLGPFQIVRMARLGALPGFLIGLLCWAALEMFGYRESDRQHQESFTKVQEAIRQNLPREQQPLGSLPAEVQQALKQVNSPGQEVSILMELATDEDPGVRTLAVAALGRYQGQSNRSQPLLTRALEDKEATVRATAVWALVGTRPITPPVEGSLLNMLKDKNDRVRETAVWAVDSLAPLLKNAKASLQESLSDANPIVRARVASALEKLPDQSSPPPGEEARPSERR
jgi:hypothetical protein